MTTDTERRLIDEYLARLERAAQMLPAATWTFGPNDIGPTPGGRPYDRPIGQI